MLDTQWILSNGSLNLLLPLRLFSGKSLILNVYKWLCKHLVHSHNVIWFVICHEKKCGHSKYIQPSHATKYLSIIISRSQFKVQTRQNKCSRCRANKSGLIWAFTHHQVAGILIPSYQTGLSLGGTKYSQSPNDNPVRNLISQRNVFL